MNSPFEVRVPRGVIYLKYSIVYRRSAGPVQHVAPKAFVFYSTKAHLIFSLEYCENRSDKGTISHVPLLIHGDLQIEKLLSIFTFPFSSPSNKNKQGLLTYVVVRSHKIKGKKGNLCVLEGLKVGACGICLYPTHEILPISLTSWDSVQLRC